MNPADLDLIVWWVYVLGLVGLCVIIYQTIAAIARREIRKAMRGYLMARTIQPRDNRGRFIKP